MNIFLITGALLFGIPSHSSTNGGELERMNVDSKSSNVTWVGEKVTGSHNGDIQISSGFITMEEGLISAATVIIDMTTINTLDLEGRGKTSLDGHLKSDDFFGTDQFPTAQFELNSVQPIRATNGMNFAANGTVTIKGRTAEVSFPIKVEQGKKTVSIAGEIKLDRSQFDVRFRSKSFFDAAELGDKLIYDEFTIAFELVANG